MSFLLASAARATVGARSGQEDSFRFWPVEGVVQPQAEHSGLLAVLADGMGGHTGGAIAGQTACATFAEAFAASATPYEERLQTALRASNEALARGVEKNSSLRGMGCTLVAAWIDASGMRWTSVGDSLLLLYRFPEVIRLNADHSLGSLLDEQARRNIITPSEAKANLNRHALRSALTGSRIELIDMRGEPLEVRAGDWIVLASDGICSLAGDEMANVIGRYRHATPAEMAEALIDAVLAKGVAGQDNATVVVVRIDSGQSLAFDQVPTRAVMRSPQAGKLPGGTRDAGVPLQDVAEPAPARRSLLGGVLNLSPAVWLGAAAGLVLVAILMALRLLPAPSSPTLPPAAPEPGWSTPTVLETKAPEAETAPPGPDPRSPPRTNSKSLEDSGDGWRARTDAFRPAPRPATRTPSPGSPSAPDAQGQMQRPDTTSRGTTNQ
jgi:protein phosphatase